MNDTIVITIPWAVVALVLLLTVAIVVFLVAFVLWTRSRWQEALESEAAEGPAGHYCPQCGTEVQPSFQFCVKCGKELR